MKKFITNIPLQKEKDFHRYIYQAVGNSLLQMDEPTGFPIIPAINAYTEPGDSIRVISMMSESEDTVRNHRFLQEELDALCMKKGISCPRGVEKIAAPEDQQVSSELRAFRRLIDFVEDDDELTASITYGTKPMSMVVLSAMRYAYRLHKNATLRCIVYGEIDRRDSKNWEDWQAYIYDETALIQMDEITWMLAQAGTEDPKKSIDLLLSMNDADSDGLDPEYDGPDDDEADEG